MKQRSIRLRLDDIIDAIDGILATVEGMDFATYSQSWQARRAIERGTEIISEATRHLPEQWLAEYPAISWLEIKAFGNRLQHKYRRVDDKIMWNIATQSVRQLRPAVIEMHERIADEMKPAPPRAPP
jgi:uncharacterized protein with HEPN domain